MIQARNTPYETCICIAVPISLMPVAPAIAQALDPLSDGGKSFDTLRATDASGNTWAVTHSPATTETANGIPDMQSKPGVLHYVVTQDYAIRWPDQEPPTLEACEAFRTGILFVAGLPLAESLAEMGLVLVPPVEA